MKKCKKCKKEYEDSSLTEFCSDCGGKIEKVLEKIAPKSFLQSIKKIPMTYIFGLVVVIVIIAVLSVELTFANREMKRGQDSVASLNLDLQKKANELSTLQDNLSKTEEGRKQLEQAKAQVDDQNKQLDARATTAEQSATKAKSDLAKTQSDLTAKQAELASKQALLASTNDQLAKAQRGVAKFNQTETLFQQFDSSCLRLLNMFAYFNNYTEAQIDAEISTNTSLYKQIKAIFDSIKTGNY